MAKVQGLPLFRVMTTIIVVPHGCHERPGTSFLNFIRGLRGDAARQKIMMESRSRQRVHEIRHVDCRPKAMLMLR